MLSDYISKQAGHCPSDENPLIYTLILGKLANHSKKDVKQDENLQKLVNKVETAFNDVNVEPLKQQYGSVAMNDLFKTKTAKTNIKDYVQNYYNAFENSIAGSTPSFEQAFAVHQTFKGLYNSEEYKNYMNSL